MNKAPEAQKPAHVFIHGMPSPHGHGPMAHCQMHTAAPAPLLHLRAGRWAGAGPGGGRAPWRRPL